MKSIGVALIALVIQVAVATDEVSLRGTRQLSSSEFSFEAINSDLMNVAWYEPIVHTLAKQIPVIGTEVAALVSIFWPEDEKPIWSQIEGEVEALIDSAILQAEMSDYQTTLDGITNLVKLYSKDAVSEKGYDLKTAIADLIVLGTKITESKNSIHLLPVAASVAVLELQLNRELVLHGEELFPASGSETESENYSLRLNNLDAVLTKWKSFFVDQYPDWKTWRTGQISSSHSCSSMWIFSTTIKASISDSLTGESRSFSSGSKSDCDWASGFASSVDARMNRDVIAAMANRLAATFTLDNFIPGNEDLKPLLWHSDFETLTMGPYSPSTVLNNDRYYSTTTSNKVNSITELQYSVGSSTIASITVSTADSDYKVVGCSIGSTTSSSSFSSDEYPTGMELHFDSDSLVGVKEHSYSTTDGEATGSLLGKSGDVTISAFMTGSWEMDAVQGYECSNQVIELHFSFASDYRTS